MTALSFDILVPKIALQADDRKWGDLSLLYRFELNSEWDERGSHGALWSSVEKHDRMTTMSQAHTSRTDYDDSVTHQTLATLERLCLFSPSTNFRRKYVNYPCNLANQGMLILSEREMPWCEFGQVDAVLCFKGVYKNKKVLRWVSLGFLNGDGWL